MRKALPFYAALLLAGCSGASEDKADNVASYDVRESASDAAGAPPSVGPTAAPGVAFNYLYAFRLPAARIAPVQEQHAAACERLGVSRCRITGMEYEQDGEDDVTAQLAFKLDPALARAFGRDGIAAVERAEGELRRAEISGTDVGAQIAAGSEQGAGLAGELARIEQRLAGRGLSGTERAELQRQAQELRASARSIQAQQGDRRAQLASTPMVFNYHAGDTGGPVTRAARDAGRMLTASLATLLVVLLTLLPWLALGLIVALIARWANRRFLGGERPARGPARGEAAVTPAE